MYSVIKSLGREYLSLFSLHNFKSENDSLLFSEIMTYKDCQQNMKIIHISVNVYSHTDPQIFSYWSF